MHAKHEHDNNEHHNDDHTRESAHGCGVG